MLRRSRGTPAGRRWLELRFAAFDPPSAPPEPGATQSFAAGVDWSSAFDMALGATLAGKLRRPVIDRTELRGPFRLELTLREDPESIVAALRDQLGLTLGESTTSTNALVIDQIESPTDH